MRVAYFLQQIFDAMGVQMKRNSLYKIENNTQKLEQVYFFGGTGRIFEKAIIGDVGVNW